MLVIVGRFANNVKTPGQELGTIWVALGCKVRSAALKLDVYMQTFHYPDLRKLNVRIASVLDTISTTMG